MSEIRLIDCQYQPTIGLRRLVRHEDLGAFVESSLAVIGAALGRAAISPGGPPYARYRGMLAEAFDVEVGLILPDTGLLETLHVDAPPGCETVVEGLPAVRAAEALHRGGYDGLSETYLRLEAWVREQGLQPLDEWWELYESGPASDPDPATWRTRVFAAVTGRPVEA